MIHGLIHDALVRQGSIKVNILYLQAAIIFCLLGNALNEERQTFDLLRRDGYEYSCVQRPHRVVLRKRNSEIANELCEDDLHLQYPDRTVIDLAK
jgi:hypothetical protein